VCLEQWGEFKCYIVIFDQLQGHSGGLIRALESCVRGPLTYMLVEEKKKIDYKRDDW